MLLALLFAAASHCAAAAEGGRAVTALGVDKNPRCAVTKFKLRVCLLTRACVNKGAEHTQLAIELCPSSLPSHQQGGERPQGAALHCDC